jgi:hypothetical protein
MESSSVSTLPHGFVSLLKLLIERQHTFLESQKPTKRDDFIYNRLSGETVETACPRGTLKRNDAPPRYSCLRPILVDLLDLRSMQSELTITMLTPNIVSHSYLASKVFCAIPSLLKSAGVFISGRG